MEWDLDVLKGKIKLPKAVTIPAKGELQVTGVTTVKGYTKRCHIIVEPYGEKQGKYKVTPVYTELNPGSAKVKVLVTNDSNKPVQLPAKMVIGVISSCKCSTCYDSSKDNVRGGLGPDPKPNIRA